MQRVPQSRRAIFLEIYQIESLVKHQLRRIHLMLMEKLSQLERHFGGLSYLQDFQPGASCKHGSRLDEEGIPLPWRENIQDFLNRSILATAIEFFSRHVFVEPKRNSGILPGFLDIPKRCLPERIVTLLRHIIGNIHLQRLECLCLYYLQHHRKLRAIELKGIVPDHSLEIRPDEFAKRVSA